MKKALSLILALVLCLSLVACGGSNANAEKAVVGEWKSLDGVTFVFNEDGTGTTPVGDEFSWKYDADTEWYVISYEGMGFNFEMKIENDIRSMNIEGEIYYHADDYEKVVEANK